jgi:twinkle protein
MVLLGARSIPVEGVYYVDQIRESMLAKFRSGITLGETTRMGYQMDEHFRWKRGEINLGVGYGNWGKTTFVLQMFLTKSIYDGTKWAVFCPENFPPDDFYDDLVEVYVGKWLNQMNEDEYNEALDFLNEHFFYVYPEDSHDIHSIHEKFRHLILKKGVDGVLIDPLNQLDHVQGKMQTIEQYYSDLYKDIKRFALLNGVYYNILAHPKNPTYGADKLLPIVDMYDIAGGAMHGNKADNIWSYYRPYFHTNKEDPTVEVYFQKIKRKRTGGKLGVVNFTLDWGKKRYADFGDIIHCDPIKAKRILSGEEHSYSQVTITGLDLDEKTEEEPF